MSKLTRQQIDAHRLEVTTADIVAALRANGEEIPDGVRLAISTRDVTLVLNDPARSGDAASRVLLVEWVEDNEQVVYDDAAPVPDPEAPAPSEAVVAEPEATPA